MKFFRKKVVYFILFVAFALEVFASGTGGGITEKMTTLVFELGIILFAARLGGMIFEKLKLPSVLGELVAGIVIGPFGLGHIAFPGFTHGLFTPTGTSFPVSPELYGIATIASIILLFSAGLETDFALFLKYSFTGVVLGVGGVIFSFFAGASVAVLMSSSIDSLMDPKAMFLGVICTATSVGITARILSEKRKMDSAEGVSIMAGAVIDDILGIIILAVVLGISAISQKGGHSGVNWGHIGAIAAKAISVWLVFTALGILFAHRISAFLKTFKSTTTFSVLALGLALLLAGVFEKAGLAMIVGAYVMGLSLSRTDLSFVIHERLHIIQTFFVPIFFTVMGMLVNPAFFLSKEVLLFGLAYTAVAVLAKVIGCGLPALFLNFNIMGALRIGTGMIPRGEVALIIAGVGLTQGVLGPEMFGASVMMTLFTTLVAPPLLSNLLKSDKEGVREKVSTRDETVATEYHFPGEETTEFVVSKLLKNFRDEAFFISVVDLSDATMYQVRKDKIAFTIYESEKSLRFDSEIADVGYIKSVVYETLIEIYETVAKLKDIEKPEDMRKELTGGRMDTTLIKRSLEAKCILPRLKGSTKEEVVLELVNAAFKAGRIDNPTEAFEAVMERERAMSTGLQKGLAIPHAKMKSVNKITLAVGIKREGLDFASADKKPTTIIALILAPASSASAHIQLLSQMTSIVLKEDIQKTLLEAKNAAEIYSILIGKRYDI